MFARVLLESIARSTGKGNGTFRIQDDQHMT